MFQIIGAMAEFERSLIQERVKASLRNARAKGKKFGRPRVEIDAIRVAALRSDRLFWSQVCRTLKVSKGSAQRSAAHVGEKESRSRPDWVRVADSRDGTHNPTLPRSRVLAKFRVDQPSRTSPFSAAAGDISCVRSELR